MASVCEAVIGACYLHHGFEETVPAVVAAFSEQVGLASETVLDFKSTLQERLARDGGRVRYEVVDEQGPPHDRHFEVVASADGRCPRQGERPLEEGGRAGGCRGGARAARRLTPFPSEAGGSLVTLSARLCT